VCLLGDDPQGEQLQGRVVADVVKVGESFVQPYNDEDTVSIFVASRVPTVGKRGSGLGMMA